MPHTDIRPLTDADVVDRKVSGLANRPTNSSGYGSHGLSAAELKARMDSYPDAIRAKLNALINAFNGADIPFVSFSWDGEPIANLSELVELIQKADFASHLLIYNDANHADSVNLKDYIKQYKQTNEQSALKSEGYAVGEQDGVPVTEGTYYQNNAKYYAGSASTSASNASSSATDAANAAGTASEQASAAEDAAAEAAGYLDDMGDLYQAKLDKHITTGDYPLLYVAYTDGSQKMWSASSEKDASFPLRDSYQNFKVGNPTRDSHCVPRKYMEDNTVPAKPNGSTAFLDVNKKISTTYIPDALIGQVEFQGTFIASTGARTPAKDFVAKEGYYWICKTNGGIKTPDGADSDFTFEVGDWAIILAVNGNEITWDKVDNTDAVSSVNGMTGAVTLTGNDIPLSQLVGSPTIANAVAARELLSYKVTHLGDADEHQTDQYYTSVAAVKEGINNLGRTLRAELNNRIIIDPTITPATIKADIARNPSLKVIYNGSDVTEAFFAGDYDDRVANASFATNDETVTLALQKNLFASAVLLVGYNLFTIPDRTEIYVGGYCTRIYDARSQIGSNVYRAEKAIDPTGEKLTNKTNSLTSLSTDTQYPSAKATYTALNEIRNVAEGKCSSYTVDETLTFDIIKSDLNQYQGKAYYKGQDITDSVLDGTFDSLIHNTDFASSSEALGFGTDDFIAVALPDFEGFILYNFADMKNGDVLYVIGTGYPDRWVSKDIIGTSKTLYPLETVRKEAVGRTVTISPSQWSNNTVTVTVQGVTATNIVICDASDPDVQATAQNTNTLTFTCTKTPTVYVTVKVVIL